MAKRIPEDVRAEIRRLYSEEGMKPVAIARQTGVSTSFVYDMKRSRAGGFDSLTEYREYLAHERGFESISEYNEHRAQQKGFQSHSKYQEHIARQHGFESLWQYRNHLAEVRMGQRTNKILADIVKTGLSELDRNQSWLARQLKVSRQTVSQYAQGKSIPRGLYLQRFLDIVCPDETRRQTLKDILDAS